MTINGNTKIASLLKESPGALEAIISISTKFEKLRNPLLRKLMAGRTSIAMASKIAGCCINDFYIKLQPLGFEADTTATSIEKKKLLPGFITSAIATQIIELDVRPVITSGKDPLAIILEKIKTLQSGQVLKIINTFEPIPLILLLEKQGFETYTDVVDDNLIETYFYKKTPSPQPEPANTDDATKGWDEIIEKFTNKLQIIDVRELEMPLPMLTILEALDQLPADTALFVYHKRIPVFLLPELAQRKLGYRIHEISSKEVHLVIFKD